MDLDRIELVARLAAEAGLSEVLVETDDWRIALKAAGPPAAAPVAQAPAEAPLAEAAPAAPVTTVRAGMVGIFRSAGPAVAPGMEIAAGQPLGQIESMRILNPVAAEQDGAVLGVLVEDGEPVEYGQALFTLAPSGEVVSSSES